MTSLLRAYLNESKSSEGSFLNCSRSTSAVVEPDFLPLCMQCRAKSYGVCSGKAFSGIRRAFCISQVVIWMNSWMFVSLSAEIRATRQ